MNTTRSSFILVASIELQVPGPYAWFVASGSFDQKIVRSG
jgi:hypothetical protein